MLPTQAFTDDDATLTITDDDATPSLSIADVSGNETAGNRQLPLPCQRPLVET